MHPLESLMQPILTVLGIVVLIQVPFVILTFIVALRETHWRATYVPVDESQALPTNTYMDLTNAMVQERGFEYLGPCRAGNEKLYRVRYDSWISPDRGVFAVVGAGRTAGIATQATWLTSQLIDERVLITVDTPGAMAADLSGMTEWKVVTNADFPELLAKHLARLEAEMTPVQPYPDDDPLGAHIELIAQRAERMARAGYVHFLDERREQWRYTFFGALARVADSYRRIFVQMFKNYGRKSMRRPGDPGYVPSQMGKSRAWLRYVEIALWVALFVTGRLWAERRPVTPQQAVFRLLVMFGAFAGLAAIWISRWWISRRTADPKRQRRRWITIALVVSFVVGLIVAARPYRQSNDSASSCTVLVGGGHLYVVAMTVRMEMLTSPLSQVLERFGRPMRHRITWHPRLHIVESDGRSARSTTLPSEESFGEVLPIGQDLYLIGDIDEGQIERWKDGRFVPVPAAEQAKIRTGLADADGLEEQCAKQGWQCTLVASPVGEQFSKDIALGGRSVHLGIALEGVMRNRKLRVRLEVPGIAPLERTFPAGLKREL